MPWSLLAKYEVVQKSGLYHPETIMLENAIDMLAPSLALLEKLMCISSMSQKVSQATLIIEASIMTDGLVNETLTKSSSREAAAHVIELPARFEVFLNSR